MANFNNGCTCEDYPNLYCPEHGRYHGEDNLLQFAGKAHCGHCAVEGPCPPRCVLCAADKLFGATFPEKSLGSETSPGYSGDIEGDGKMNEFTDTLSKVEQFRAKLRAEIRKPRPYPDMPMSQHEYGRDAGLVWANLLLSEFFGERIKG